MGWRGARIIRQRARRPHRRPYGMLAGFLFVLVGAVLLQAGVGAGADRRHAAAIPVGSLIQLRGDRGCLSERPRDGCSRARGLAGAGGVAVAGRYVYVASAHSSAVAVFRRNPVTGALRQLAGTAGCVSETGQDGCATGRGLSFAFSLAITPDGRGLYVAGLDDVASFARNPRTGTLTQLPGSEGCIAERPGDGCAQGRGLRDVASVAVSPDGRNVYAAASANQVVGYGKSAVVALARNSSTGALTQLPGPSGCTNGDGSDGCQQGRALQLAFAVVVAPDGRHVYVGSELSSAVASFERESDGSLRQIPFPGECTSEGGRDGCATGRGLSQVAGLAITPGGGDLYAGAARSSAVGAMFLTPATGGIDQLKGPYGCTAEGGLEGCATGRGLAGAGPVAISPDGRTVYVAGLDSLSAFAREQSNGRIDQLPGIHGCLAEARSQDGCAAARGLTGAASVAVSPDGRWVYVAALPNSRQGTLGVFARVPPGGVALHVQILGNPRRCVSAPFHVTLRAQTTLPVNSLTLALDRRTVARAHQDHLRHRVGARRLRRGAHTLQATVTDLAGDTRRVSARFRRC